MSFIADDLHLIIHSESAIIYRTTTKAFYTVFYRERRSFGSRMFKRKKYKCIYNYLIDLVFLPIVIKTVTERIVSYNDGYKGKLKTGEVDILVEFLDNLNKEVLNGNVNMFTNLDGWELLQTKRGYSYDNDVRTRFVLQGMALKGNVNNARNIVSSLSLADNVNTLFIYAPTLSVEEIWLNGLKPEHLAQGVKLIAKGYDNIKKGLPKKYGFKQSVTDVLVILRITSDYLKNETRINTLIKNYISVNDFVTVTITKQ